MSLAAQPGSGFRQTPVGELPLEWAIAPLGDLFHIQQGKALSQPARAGPNPRPFLRTANVFWGRLDLRTLDRMHFSDEEVARLSLKAGDLLVCEGGEIGRTAIWKGALAEVGFQNHLHRLRAKSGSIDSGFVMYWMQAAFLHLGLYAGIGNKTTIPNLSGSRLKQLLVPVPPLDEQRAIADVLSKLQATLEIQDRIVATLRELKAATMAKLFREGVRGGRLKMSEIGDIPENWQIKSIGDPNFSRTSSGGTPSRAVPEYFQGRIPWVKSGELRDGNIATTEETISEDALMSSSARILPAGTLLVAMYGATAGMTGVLDVPAATNQAVCAVMPVRKSFTTEFLRHYFIFARRRILAERRGGAQPNVSQTILRSLAVPAPEIEEQEAIGSVLAKTAQRITAAERRRRALRSLFESVLSEVITGNIRVQHGRDIHLEQEGVSA